jgi:hypothetical protein
MRTSRFALIIAALALLPACSDDSTEPNQPTPSCKDNAPVNVSGRTLHEIRDVDYVHSQYFYFDDPAIFVGPNAATVKVYRTVTPAELANDPSIVHAMGWAAPDPEGWGHGIGAILTPLISGNLPTEAIEQDFELLALNVDYTFIRSPSNNAVIGFALTEAIPDTDQRALAVSYVTIDGWAIGGTYEQLGVPQTAPDYAADRLVLELIKTPDPDPSGEFPSTWLLEMRNVYDIGMTDIQGSSLEVEIVDVLVPRTDPSIPNGSTVPYLQIFGLDQVDCEGAPQPDGRFDVKPARVDLEKGLLFFPVVKPFHPDASKVNEWTDGVFAFTGSFQAQYDNSLAPTRENEVHQYVIKVLSKQE